MSDLGTIEEESILIVFSLKNSYENRALGVKEIDDKSKV